MQTTTKKKTGYRSPGVIALLTLVLAAVNASMLFIHIQVFQSRQPVMVLATLFLHIVFLIFFPYKKLYSK